MYHFLPLMLILVGYASNLLCIVVLNPAPWDRNVPIAPIERNSLSVSYSRGEGASMKPARSTLILTITSRPETLLQQAVADNDYDKVHQLLASHEDPDVQNHHGFTALHFAAALGYADLVNLLLSYNADPTMRDDLAQATPLHLTCIAAHTVDIVKLLIKYGADVTIPDIYGYTALHTAAAINAQEIATFLLEAGADGNAATFEATTAMMRSSSTLRMSTPLHEAAMHGQVAMVQLLLEHGACGDVQTIDHKTPLHLALIYGHMPVAHLFLTRGCSLEDAPEQSLIQAAFKGDCEIVELLIAHGFDVNKAITEKVDGGTLDITPLCAACQNKNAYEMVQLLLVHGALINGTDSEGSTPLINAVEFTDEKTVALLIEHAADINKANKRGVTSLHMAAFVNKVDIVKILVHHGAHVNTKDNNHETPLQIALRRNNQEVVVFLKSLESKETLVIENTNPVIQNTEKNEPCLSTTQNKKTPIEPHEPDKNTKSSDLVEPSPKEDPKPSLLRRCYELIKKEPVMCIVGTIVAAYCIQDALKNIMMDYKKLTSFTYSL